MLKSIVSLLMRDGVDMARFAEMAFVRRMSHEEISGSMGISVRRSKYLKKKAERMISESDEMKILLSELTGG
jgi:hypothetical protein